MSTSRRLSPLAPLIAVLLVVTAVIGAASATVATGASTATIGAATVGAATVDPGTIEDFPDYDPQRRCSPRAKKGALHLEAWLLRRYRGSGSSGISRACRSGGVSEHKEGRAVDWRLDARKARDRRYAADFIARIRATDRAGNEAALGRRMGIMYVIWNDRIFSAYQGYRPEPYRSGSCRKLRRCSATLRHRDHVHISLSWRAARGRTSWYAGRLS